MNGLYEVLGGSNVFIVDDPASGVTLIDAGLPGTANRVLHQLQAIGRTPPDVKHILITHADFDHVGDLKKLVDATGARVIASALGQTYLQRRTPPPHMHFPLSWLARAVSLVIQKSNKVDQIVSGGEVLPIAGGIRAIATPGHTPDHLSFYWERERVLFAGDLFRYNDHKLTLSPKRITHDQAAVEQSARAVLALEPAVICPGHGQVWTRADAPDQLQAVLAL